MVSKEEIIKDIKDSIYHVNHGAVKELEAKAGVVDKFIVDTISSNVVKEGISYLGPELVTVEKSYPKDDKMKVKFHTHFVAIKILDLVEIIKKINEL